MATKPPRYAEEPIGDLLKPTVEGILDWARKTDPPPARREVVDHVNALWRDGLLERADVEKLAVDFPELAGFE